MRWISSRPALRGAACIVLAALGGCERPAARAAEAKPAVERAAAAGAEDLVIVPGAGGIDSALPRDEALRRFRAGLAPVDSLRGGAGSRDELVRAFVRALEARDTARLAALAMTREEFAYLYYPTATEALPPYSQGPELMWFLLFRQSDRGIRLALERRGGRPLGVTGYVCPAPPAVEGENRVWSSCRLRRAVKADTVEEHLFGPMLERGGRFKFVSYVNKL